MYVHICKKSWNTIVGPGQTFSFQIIIIMCTSAYVRVRGTNGRQAITCIHSTIGIRLARSCERNNRTQKVN